MLFGRFIRLRAGIIERDGHPVKRDVDFLALRSDAGSVRSRLLRDILLEQRFAGSRVDDLDLETLRAKSRRSDPPFLAGEYEDWQVPRLVEAQQEVRHLPGPDNGARRFADGESGATDPELC